MDLLRPIRRFDAFQRRHAPLAIPVAVLRNFSDQAAGNAAVDLHQPTYAVAPGPEPGEPAVPVSTQLATLDLHTLSLDEVLQAVDRELGQLAVPEGPNAQAHSWIQSARARLRDGGEADPAAGALAQAAQRALGLARLA